MRKSLVLFLSLVAATAHGQIVTNVIDTLTTGSQSLSVLSGANTNTTAASGAIGGFRTITLVANTEGDISSAFAVSTNSRRLTLSTPPDATANFSVTWGGAGGTNGLGGLDLIGGNLTPSQSNLKFNVRRADFASSFTWSFIDTLSQTSSFTGTFPVEPVADPELPFSIALSSFTGSINWNSINFITLSGGGVDDLDLVLSTANLPFSVETTVMAPVPEPGTWAAAALLAGVAGFIHWRRRRVAA